MSQNYFNSLPFRMQLGELSQCRFMSAAEFSGIHALVGKSIVIIGCGAQGLHQGLNLRDSGLNVSYALRETSINEKRQSWKNATENDFSVATCEALIPSADLVINLTPDKHHTQVVSTIMPMMKEGACLSYSHGFNIVEEGMKIRDDITVILVAPKSPGTEVREEFRRGFGVPTLLAVHRENDPRGEGWELAKAYCCGIGGDKAGALQSTFIAEVKSDHMGEQTVLCGMLQTGSILCFDKMVEKGIDSAYASQLVQKGWQVITEAMKHGGITNMMNRLSNPAKVKAFDLAEELTLILRPLFEKHMDDIISGAFSQKVMEEWSNNDKNLLFWRNKTQNSGFEKSSSTLHEIPEQEFFDHGILMVAMIKAGVELAYDVMVATGFKAESAYYETLHEVPLIANTIARKKLYEMHTVISDTAEFGTYLFSNAAIPLLKDFMKTIETDVIGKGLALNDNGVDNLELIEVNDAISYTDIEAVGEELRSYMYAMKPII